MLSTGTKRKKPRISARYVKVNHDFARIVLDHRGNPINSVTRKPILEKQGPISDTGPVMEPTNDAG